MSTVPTRRYSSFAFHGPDAGGLRELRGQAADGACRHRADLLGPLGRELEAGLLHPVETGARLPAAHLEGALKGTVLVAAVEGHGRIEDGIPHKRLAGGGIALVVAAILGEQVTGVGAVLGVPLVHGTQLVQDDVAHAQDEGRGG